MEAKTTFKIVIIGDSGMGKSSYVERFKSGSFLKEHKPTMGVEVSPLGFFTNKGYVIANVWDCAGKKELGMLEDAYWVGANGAMIFFDLTNPESYANTKMWLKKLRFVCPNIPVILCGNKCDLGARINRADITLQKSDKLTLYFDLSAKSCYNQDKPFLHLFRALFKARDLAFVDAEV
uniref:GTP-binding nuclear protein n=1 Tax=viral metagenome TaxID=1070528 RepID=A0A6C0ELN0_9ZZZZ